MGSIAVGLDKTELQVALDFVVAIEFSKRLVATPPAWARHGPAWCLASIG